MISFCESVEHLRGALKGWPGKMWLGREVDKGPFKGCMDTTIQVEVVYVRKREGTDLWYQCGEEADDDFKLEPGDVKILKIS